MSTYENKETVNTRHEEPMKAHDGNISIYESGKNICHSIYELTVPATYSIQEVSMSLIEELFHLQMIISFPFLRAKHLRTPLLITITRSF